MEWTDFHRDDLNHIPFMRKNGYEEVFSYPDAANGRTTPSRIPHDPVGFRRGNIRVWKLCRWQVNPDSRFRTLGTLVTYYNTAILEGGAYREHKPFDTLEEVVTFYTAQK